MDEDAAGLLMACFGAGSFCGNALGGAVSDRIGAVRTQVLALSGAGPAFALLAFMHEPWAIATALFLLGTVLDTFRPGNLSAISSSCPAEQQGRAFALNRLAANAGWSIGPALGGQLASIGYVWLFIVDGTTSMLAGIVLLFGARRLGMRLKARLTGDTPAPVAPAVPAATSPLRDRTFVVLLLWNWLATLSYMMFFHLGPLYLKEQRGYSEGEVGLVLALNPAVIMLCEMVLVHHLRRRPPLRVVALGSLLLACGIGLFPLSPHASWIVGTMLVWTLGEMLQAPMMAAYVGRRAPPGTRGRYLGLYGTTFSVAWVLSPILGTQLYKRLHPDSVWYCSCLFALAASLGFWTLARSAAAAPAPSPAAG
jgi:predicted MFS family arabinose efflux permease